jgi:hypothetical protein
MKTKMKTLQIRRARTAKMNRNIYFGMQLPMQEGFLAAGSKWHHYN